MPLRSALQKLLSFCRGLEGKSFLLISVLLIACSMALGGNFLLHEIRDKEEKLFEKGSILAQNLAANVELGVYTRNQAELELRITSTLEQQDVAFVAIRDQKGRVLFSHIQEGFSPSDFLLGPNEGLRALPWEESKQGRSVKFQDPREREEYYLVDFPVKTYPEQLVGEEIGFLPDPGTRPDSMAKEIGCVTLGLSTRTLKADIRQLRQAMGQVTLIVIFIGILLTVLLVRIVLKPINRLAEATRRMADGDHDVLLHMTSHDEIGDLARSFDQMAVRLRASRTQLEENNLQLERKVRERTKELEDTQSQLLQAEKMSVVGQLVSGVAHELNNPLAGVLGYSQLLLRLPSSDQVQRGLRKIEMEAERCRRTVQHLQVFARKSSPKKRPVALNEILEEVLDLFEYQVDAGHIKVEKHLSPSLPRTMADAEQMQQVFVNLIENAQQAMKGKPEGALLRLRSGVTGGRVHIQVSDSGPGIPPQDLKKVFDPFFTTKEVGQGTGLGLSICYGIIQQHRGRIWAESVVDEGTTFHLLIPIQEEVETAAPSDEKSSLPEVSESGEGERARILIVDDERTILEILQDILLMDGYIIETASDGHVALARIREGDIDLVISDLRMPGMSGMELFERARKLGDEVCCKFIFTTGDVASQESHAFLSRTGSPYLQKPFDLREVRHLVREVLSGGFAQRAELPVLNPSSPHDPDPSA